MFLERTTWEARGVLEKGSRRTCCVFGAYNMGRPGEC